MKDDPHSRAGEHSSSHAAMMSLKVEDAKNIAQQAEEGQEPPPSSDSVSSTGSSSVIGELLKPEATAALSRAVATAMVRMEERHSGPLPSPKHLKQYEECHPGLAERIVSMAEREQAHRHKTIDSMETFRSATLKHLSRRDARGQYLGAALATSVLGFCFYLASHGSPQVGGWVAVATMVGLAGVFVTKKITRGSDTKDDDEQLSKTPEQPENPSGDEKS